MTLITNAETKPNANILQHKNIHNVSLNDNAIFA